MEGKNEQKWFVWFDPAYIYSGEIEVQYKVPLGLIKALFWQNCYIISLILNGANTHWIVTECKTEKVNRIDPQPYLQDQAPVTFVCSQN